MWSIFEATGGIQIISQIFIQFLSKNVYQYQSNSLSHMHFCGSDARAAAPVHTTMILPVFGCMSKSGIDFILGCFIVTRG